MGSEAIQQASGGKLDSENDTPTRYSFATLLDVLGHVDDYRHDQVAVCWKRPGRDFMPELQAPQDAPRFVDTFIERIQGGVDVWFGVNPISSLVTEGRGTVKDIDRLAALYADLDVKPGACPDLDTARGRVRTSIPPTG